MRVSKLQPPNPFPVRYNTVSLPDDVENVRRRWQVRYNNNSEVNLLFNSWKNWSSYWYCIRAAWSKLYLKEATTPKTNAILLISLLRENLHIGSQRSLSHQRRPILILTVLFFIMVGSIIVPSYLKFIILPYLDRWTIICLWSMNLYCIFSSNRIFVKLLLCLPFVIDIIWYCVVL